MPVYAYTCRDCGTPLEVRQEFSDPALTECPVCGGVLRKRYGSIGVTFNGSGFYRTDSRSGSGDGGSGESKGDSGSGEKKADSGTKTESKPAAPPAASTPAASAPASGSSAS